MLITRSDLSPTNLHVRAACDSALLSGLEQMITKSTHINRRMLDLVLTDFHDVVGVRIGSSVGTSDHSVIFIDVALKQLFLTWCLGRRSISITM